MQNGLINKSCCFTGHRPCKLGIEWSKVKELLEEEIDGAILDGYVTFITGMAMGTDILAAEIIIERKKHNNNLRLVCALPHPNFDSRRNAEEKIRFNKIIENSDIIEEVNNHCFRGCYQIRNEWMVNHSSLVIAVFNGQKGGTKNTIDYAKNHGVIVHNVLKNII